MSAPSASDLLAEVRALKQRIVELEDQLTTISDRNTCQWQQQQQRLSDGPLAERRDRAGLSVDTDEQQGRRYYSAA